MKIKLRLITCLFIFTSACSTIKKSSSSYSAAQINNIAWAVISFKGKPLAAADFPNGVPTIIFSMQDGKISGNDGCNSFLGVAKYSATVIKTGAIASTKMACANISFENTFFEVLASPVIAYHLHDNVLRLFVNDAEVMALKEKE
jgi:heat shock protein HslJ